MFWYCIQYGCWWGNSLPSLRCIADKKRWSATGELRQGPHLIFTRAAVRNYGQWALKLEPAIFHEGTEGNYAVNFNS